MMLRNLLDEVRSRRMLAFAALGVLVALALPLLFLKSAPESAPQADAAAPAAAKEAKLPARAARLLDTTDAGTAGGRTNGSSHDPFNPPSAYRSATTEAAKGGAAADAGKTDAPKGGGGGGGSSSTKPVPVVIENPDATTPSSSDNDSADSSPSRHKLTVDNASVDIRFGPRVDTPIKRAIPQKKGLYIHGRLVAMFVKYSPSRDAAVFAVAPGLRISGPVRCRVIGGACRYLDIPAGGHAWLTTATANRTIVRRRLDVVRIKRRTPRSSIKATSASVRSESSCLMRKLVAMERGDALIDRDACKS